MLAVVSRGGLHTLYELQHDVGLQPGGIQPTLRRLEDDGLLTRSEEGKRRRRVMKVSEKGERLLQSDWQDCLRDYPDVESILRVATVTVLMKDFELAHHYLMGVADEHERKIGLQAPVAIAEQVKPLELYSCMRTLTDTRVRQAVAATLRGIASELGKLFGIEQGR